MLVDKVGVFDQPVAKEIEERGFDAAEAVVVALNLRRGELEGVGVAFAGKAVDDGASGVAEIHNLGGLVDGFAGGIVDGLSEDFHLEVAVQKNDLGMSAADEKAHKGELRRDIVV